VEQAAAAQSRAAGASEHIIKPVRMSNLMDAHMLICASDLLCRK
jgi:hypothetical protein